MIIVGELINASRKAVAAAIENKDEKAIQQLTLDQAENGAHYINVNAGMDYLKAHRAGKFVFS
jgi:cobalamin-dependent methionine synthase I